MIYNLALERHIYNTVLQKAVSRGWYGNCVPVSIILSECLSCAGIPNRLTSGFLHIAGVGEKLAVYHCWVETKLGIMDISSDISKYLFPEKDWHEYEMDCSEEIQAGFLRSDMDTETERMVYLETKKLCHAYQSDKSSFWKKPRAIQMQRESFQMTIRFRDDILYDLKQCFW